jgi:hypothetical protein
VTSNEPTNGTGDGDTDTDWEVVSNHLVRLRAERAAQGNGRIYTITVTAKDGAGNETVKTVNVVVSHNIVSPLSGHAVKVGTTVSFSGTFWDKPGNRHTASWSLDGNTSVKAAVVEPSGLRNGTVTGAYKFTAPGIYKLQLNVRDQSGVTTSVNTAGDLEAIVVVYDPNGGYTVGGGWLASPAGALSASPAATGKVSYGFQSNYYKGATYPKGETQFEFKVGNLEFNALNFEYLSVARGKAQFKGSGKVLGDQSGYSFILTVIDGAIAGGADKMRMKIFNKTTGRVIYDNQPGASDAADPLTVVGSGSTIVIGGVSVATARASAGELAAEPATAGGLTITAAPNPAPDAFTLTIASDQYREEIILQVYDVYGRVVDTRSVTHQTTLKIGQDYQHGAYYARVMQGRKRKEIKLIKLNN